MMAGNKMPMDTMPMPGMTKQPMGAMHPAMHGGGHGAHDTPASLPDVGAPDGGLPSGLPKQPSGARGPVRMGNGRGAKKGD